LNRERDVAYSEDTDCGAQHFGNPSDEPWNGGIEIFVNEESVPLNESQEAPWTMVAIIHDPLISTMPITALRFYGSFVLGCAASRDFAQPTVYLNSLLSKLAEN